MEVKYVKEGYVSLAKCCEPNGLLSYSALYDLFEDGFSYCLTTIECDNLTLRVKYNAMWVVISHDLTIYKRLSWNDFYHLESKIVYFNKILCFLESTIVDKDNNLVAKSLYKLCALDFATFRIKRVKDVGLNVLVDNMEEVDIPKYNQSLITNKIGEYTARALDIDSSRHINNCKYLDIILNTYSLEEYLSLDATKIHMEFLSQTKFGTKLDIYKNTIDNTDAFLLKDGNNSNYLAVITKKCDA